MPVDDVPFYNVIGEQISRSLLVEQMIGYYNLKYAENETKITDFNEGSEIRNLLESVAVDLYILMQQVNNAGNIAFIHTAEGFWLDKHGANPFINLPRIMGKESEGVVKFSLVEAATEPVLIPAGTVLISEGGLDFITNIDCTIMTGETSSSVGVTCATVGEDTNVPAGNISIIDGYTLNGVTVTNEAACTGGLDTEDDDVYRERLLAHVRRDDFGSIGYYKNLLESIPGVHDVALVDATGYTKKALINGYSKPTSESILLQALTYLTDVEKIVLGHNFTVDAPAYKTLNLSISLDVTGEYSETQLNNILETFINGGSSEYIVEFDGYSIGEDLVADDLVQMFFVLDNVVGVSVVDDDLSNVLIDVSVGSGEVLKLGTVSWTQTVVE